MHVLRELQWPSGAAAGACEDADWAPQTPAVREMGAVIMQQWLLGWYGWPQQAFMQAP